MDLYVNANDFKDEKSDSQMIQSALDKAREIGAVAVVPRINARTGANVWNISETILLDSNTTLVLQGCHLRMADGVICNMFANRSARETVCSAENRQSDIHITGSGGAVLDGGEHNGLYEFNGIGRKVMKPSKHHVTENVTLFFRNAENIVIENITIRDQRYWACVFCFCAYGRVSSVRLESASNVPNQDGIDLGKGCHDFIIENITGCVGDNAVALCATDNGIYPGGADSKRSGDIRNVTIRNIMVYGVGGCALIRLLNHDGYRLYNIRIDNVIETSPWADTDAALAKNPDLNILTDSNGDVLPYRKLVPGEEGYRAEEAIIIGESYWYKDSPAQHGDTFGISVSNVMTHARFAVGINNTLRDSSFDNIRVFGNGYMFAYFGRGTVENVRFTNLSRDFDAAAHAEDGHISVEWNGIETNGLSNVYFNGTRLKNVRFSGIEQNGSETDSLFGGHGEGGVAYALASGNYRVLSDLKGISIREY